MQTTGDKAFVDTNILLRAIMPQMTLHKQAEGLIQSMWDNDVDLWISPQVIREYLVQATHPATFNPPLTLQQVLTQLETIQSLFRVADENGDVTAQLLALIKTYSISGKQIHDANIIATMLTYNIKTWLTFNTVDMHRFEPQIMLYQHTS